MEDRSIVGVLRSVLAGNRALLQNRNALTDAMDHAVPARLAREYLPIRKAMTEAAIGETLYHAASGEAAAREAARQNAMNALMRCGVPEIQADAIVGVMADAADAGRATVASPVPASVASPVPASVASPAPAVRSEAQPVSSMSAGNTWNCTCGQKDNTGNFCQSCGSKRPMASESERWICAKCSAANEGGNFCASCGAARSSTGAANSSARRKRNVSAAAATTLGAPAAAPVLAAAAAAPPAPMPMTMPAAGTPSVAASMPPPSSAFPPGSAGGPVGWQVARQRLNDEIFTTEGRLNRWPYFVKSFLMGLVGGFVATVLLIIPIIGPLISFVIGIAMAVGGWMLIIRRLHDLNKSGWFSLLLFVPIIDFFFGLYLLFVKGTDGPNEYGPDPLQPIYMPIM